MKISQKQIMKVLDEITLDIDNSSGRVELHDFDFHIHNPHLPAEGDNVSGIMERQMLKDLTRAGIDYSIRVEPSTCRGYVCLSYACLARLQQGQDIRGHNQHI